MAFLLYSMSMHEWLSWELGENPLRLPKMLGHLWSSSLVLNMAIMTPCSPLTAQHPSLLLVLNSIASCLWLCWPSPHPGLELVRVFYLTNRARVFGLTSRLGVLASTARPRILDLTVLCLFLDWPTPPTFDLAGLREPSSLNGFRAKIEKEKPSRQSDAA